MLAYLPTAVEKAEQQGELRYAAVCKRQLGLIARFQGRLDDAVKYLEAAVESVRNANDLAHEAEYVRSLGMVYFDKGDMVTARRLLEESLSKAESWEQPNRDGMRAHVLNCLTDVALKEHRLDEAQSYLDESQEIAERLNIGISLLVIYRLRGKLALASGRVEEAERCFHQSLNLSLQFGLYQDEGYANRWLATAALSQGKMSFARQYAYWAYEIFNRLGMKNQTNKVIDLIAQIESGITELPTDAFEP